MVKLSCMWCDLDIDHCDLPLDGCGSWHPDKVPLSVLRVLRRARVTRAWGMYYEEIMALYQLLKFTPGRSLGGSGGPGVRLGGSGEKLSPGW